MDNIISFRAECYNGCIFFFLMCFTIENNFNSDVAKREGFWPTSHKLTPQLKGEKCKKILYILQQRRPTPKEEKKEKEAVNVENEKVKSLAVEEAQSHMLVVARWRFSLVFSSSGFGFFFGF
jgi:hypothetical protein